jgi:neutral ceramidase
MFVMGCGGSANPWPRGTVEHVEQHGNALGNEVCRVLDEKLTPLTGDLAFAFQRVSLPLQAAMSRETAESWAKRGGWQQFIGQRILEKLDRGETLDAELSCPVSLWRLGDRLTLVGLSGEVVGEYVPLVEQSIGPRDLWVAGYCHDVFGYVPTRQVLAEGGYETRGVIYRGVGLFAPKVEQCLLDAVRGLAQKVGRE